MADTKTKPTAAADTQAKASPPASSTPAATTITKSSTPASSSAAAPVTEESPLESPWTFYFDKKLPRDAHAGGLNTFAQNLKKVGTFDTVQGFWRHYSHMQAPDAIPRDHSLYLIRRDHLPAWETFPHGGAWIIKVRKGNGVINRLWEELCFAAVGEWFEDPDFVGVVLSTRTKDDNIAVWCHGTPENAMNTRIGERMKELLNLDESTQVEFKAFRSAIQDGSSFRNAKVFAYAPAP